MLWLFLLTPYPASSTDETAGGLFQGFKFQGDSAVHGQPGGRQASPGTRPMAHSTPCIVYSSMSLVIQADGKIWILSKVLILDTFRKINPLNFSFILLISGRSC